MSAADAAKQRGNELFAKGKFSAAADAYTEAITLNPENTVYYTNRALCFMKLGQLTRVVEDCDRALRLDSQAVKAYYLKGQALLERNDVDAAIAALEKATALCKGSAVSYVKDVAAALREARKRRWRAQQTEYEDLAALVLSDFTYLTDEAQRRESAAPGAAAAAVAREYAEKQTRADRLFRLMNERMKPLDAPPDYLCCKISLDLMRDPVITPAGISYDREWIVTHLRRNGNFDPTTRQPLTEAQLVPNLALREAIEAFLAEHPNLDQ